MDDDGWYAIHHRTCTNYIFDIASMPKPIQGWKDDFFYVEWTTRVWANILPHKWCLAQDQTYKKFKLTQEEKEGTLKRASNKGLWIRGNFCRQDTPRRVI